MPRKKEGRAANGKSSIYWSDSDERWHGRVTVGVKDNGDPDRRHVSSKDPEVVEKKVTDLEKMRDEGSVEKAGASWTVERWLDYWLNDISVLSTTENGWDAYYYAVKHLSAGVGKHRLKRLRANHLEALYRKMLAGGARAGTVHQVHRTIRTALNEAVNREFISKNPAKIAKAPAPDDDEVEPFTNDEIRRLFSTARQYRNSTRWVIAIALGLRQGEALGLKWSDVNFQEQKIRVRRTRLRPKYKHGCAGSCGRKQPGFCPQKINTRPDTKDTKSKAGRRTIGLPAPLVAELTRHRAEQDAERAEAGELWNGEGWIFLDELGHKIQLRTDWSHWKELLAKAGVRDARLHDARHTAATVLLELGVNHRAAQGVMGWSNSAMAARYQHLTDPIRQAIADQVAGHLWDEPTALGLPEEPPNAG